MPRISLGIKPGIFRDGTRYSAEGVWYDCDKVRFRKGWPEKIGGWVKFIAGKFLGSCRKIHDWGTVGGARYVGLGTTVKLYVQQGASPDDVTPVRLTATLGTNPLTTVIGETYLEVAHTAHGAVAGAYVTISGATATNGIPAGEINTEHRIKYIEDANTYFVEVSTAATSSGTGGGSAVDVEYQINPGLDYFVPGSGWGSGSWGETSWGGSTTVGANNQLRLWSIDNFGDDMVACSRGGGVYYWDESDGLSTRAIYLHELTRRTITLGTDPLATVNTSATVTVTDISAHGAGVGDTVTLSGVPGAVNGIPAAELNASHTIVSVPTDTTFTITVSTSATSTGSGGGSAVVATYEAGEYHTPTSGLQAMVSPVARHIIVFGTNDVGGTELDPMLVRWCTSENAAEWEPRRDNSAGGQRLSTGSLIVGAIRTRQEVIIWTDSNMVSMRYVGQPYIFSFNEISANVSMISQNAAAVANDVVYFMDRGGFYTYAGRMQRLLCPVRDYIFSDIDFTEAGKIFCGTNVDYSEVLWFYPSLSGDGEIDKYVAYNYDDGVFTYGTLARGYWDEAPTKTYPLASSMFVSTKGTVALESTNTSPTMTVHWADHGLSVGDTVVLSGFAAIGGWSAAGDETEQINKDHVVASVVDSDSFTITMTSNATSTAGGSGSPDTNGIVRAPNVLYSHEVGHDDDGVAFTAYIESADQDIEDGDSFWFINRLLPDVEFRDSESSTDSVVIDLYGHDYPAGNRTRRTTSTIYPSTEQDYIRMRSRLMSMRVESTGAGYGWRLGNMRVEARKDGKR